LHPKFYSPIYLWDVESSSNCAKKLKLTAGIAATTLYPVVGSGGICVFYGSPCRFCGLGCWNLIVGCVGIMTGDGDDHVSESGKPGLRNGHRSGI
jgi:hypothetical protein